MKMDLPRHFAGVNWRGLYTLCLKETLRFFDSWMQTILGPAITSLLFLAVFALALHGDERRVGDLPFLEFLAPGLIAMTVAQNAFANSSFSILVSKLQGNIVDVLMPPIGPVELTIGYVFGGVARGVVCGIAVAAGMALFVPFSIYDPLILLFHAVCGSMMLSLFGVLAGVISEKFDHIGSITNFIVSPLAFLSGTFYSIANLPEFFQKAALYNPFFYMIDGFRFAFTGHADAAPIVGVLVMTGINLLMLALVYRLISTGYKLKA
jgi:ABC-2 type transport system permease protein